MSRADVAAATVRAGARQSFVRFRSVRFRALRKSLGSRPAYPFRDATNIEQAAKPAWSARWLMPFALCCLTTLLGATLLRSSYQEHDKLVASAAADLGFLASVIADDVDNRSREQPAAATHDVLDRFIPGQAMSRGQRVIVADPTGAVVAAIPHMQLSGSIARMLGTTEAGDTHPLAVFAEKAGVMHVTMLDGSDVLATVRTLQAPFGQLLLVQPLEDVLCDWRSGHRRMRVVFLLVAFILAVLVLAYLRQAVQTHRADRVCRTMRDRVDMVLARGRCGLWDWDVASGRIEWSKSMFEMVGMAPRGEVLSFAEVNALIHPGDGGLDALARIVASNAAPPVEHVFRMRGGSGAWVWLRTKAEMVEVEGGGAHLIGIAVDITDAMALEERTARADMRLRDAIETISEAFVVWDADNRLVMCNSKFQRFHNLPPDAVRIGTPYVRVMERGTAPLIHSQISLGEQQPLGARTFEAQFSDGRWLQINERRTKDGGYVSVGTDITTLKRHEEQLLESERRLMNTVIDLRKSRLKLEQQAQQLSDLADKYLDQKAEAETANRAKSDFLANMGHELRTPLNAILGFSEIMTLESFGKLGSPQYLDYSTHIHQSGQHLLAMIADILEMARLEAGRVRLEKSELVIGEAVAAAVASVTAAADRNGVAIEVEGTHAAAIVADRNALEKILTIFLNNAVKYTPAGGRIVLRSRRDGATLDLSVEDTGVGMPPDAVARLGRPFEQANPALRNGIRGSGLGLAIARSLIELHGGTMRICSAEGTGTTVSMELPCRMAPVRQQQAAATPMRLPAPRLAPAVKAVVKLSRSA